MLSGKHSAQIKYNVRDNLILKITHPAAPIYCCFYMFMFSARERISIYPKMGHLVKVTYVCMYACVVSRMLFFLSDRGEGLNSYCDRRSAFSAFILMSLNRRGLDRGELPVTTESGRDGNRRWADIHHRGQQMPKLPERRPMTTLSECHVVKKAKGKFGAVGMVTEVFTTKAS